MPRKRFYGFRSGFARKLDGFISHRASLGYSTNSYFLLNSFDEYCAFRFPSQSLLTQEVVCGWVASSPRGIINRCTQIRMFARYLVFLGEDAYVYPSKMVPPRRDGEPYVFSQREKELFFAAADSYPRDPKSPLVHFVPPVVFRLMLCCGLRPREAVSISRGDVDLAGGTLHIVNSKSHRDRIVTIPADLLDVCRRFDAIAESFFPSRKAFFPNRLGNGITYPSLAHLYHATLERSGISGERVPPLYAFRFTFATDTVLRWQGEGIDVDAMAPYLSAYMGHAKYKDTYHYIRMVPERLASMPFMDDSDVIPGGNGDGD